MTGGNDSDPVLDTDQQAKDREFAERVFRQAVDALKGLGTEWPNGGGHVMQRLTMEIPDHCWTVLHRQQDNIAISQPANEVFVMIYDAFIALGFKR